MSAFVPVILSGGAGTRLWPLSREHFPKQLQRLAGEHSLLQQAVLRCGSAPLVICNDDQRFIVAEQMREIGVTPRAIAIEPVGRNTAPAVAVAALMLADDPDAVMLVMPSDHLIKDVAAFDRAIAAGLPQARAGKLVTFGVVPTSPHTGYGYIRRGEALSGGVEQVDSFVEKPDLDRARAYLAEGRYLWNSGIFLMSPTAFLAELRRIDGAMVDLCVRALADGVSDLFFHRLDAAAFSAIAGQAIDTAVMEKTDHAAVVPVDMGWSDIGSWSALWNELDKDDSGNATQGNVVTRDTANSLVLSTGRLVTTLGLRDCVVVATEDAVLVAAKSADQEVKALVDSLKRDGRPEATDPVRCYRPWGWFQTVDTGHRYRVKLIQVNPGQKLSLQKHWHRSEHWIVVTGTALVDCGDNQFTLRENESTFIPAGTAHRLENPGKVTLRIIEVQSGEYLGEDDIIRLEDSYGRAVGADDTQKP